MFGDQRLAQTARVGKLNDTDVDSEEGVGDALGEATIAGSGAAMQEALLMPKPTQLCCAAHT